MTKDIDKVEQIWRPMKTDFLEVHHYSSSKYKSIKSRGNLQRFLEHCRSKDSIGTENRQTIRRALEVGNLMGKGLKLKAAIKISWKEYPILTR